MLKKNKILISIAVLLVISQAGLLFCFLIRNTRSNYLSVILREPCLPDRQAQDDNLHYSFYSDKNFFDEAYDLLGDNNLQINCAVKGLIVPHHLMVKENIAQIFKSVANQKFDQVILIGPDHEDDSRFEITTSLYDWQTPHGILNVDFNFINNLIEKDLAKVDEKAMAKEHAVSGLVPFIKRSWPNINLTPIIFSSKVESEQVENLAEKIFNSTKNKKVLVIASVDFSHFKSAEKANLNDEISQKAIENFDFEKVYDLDLDSPASIYFLLKYLDLKNARKTVLTSHTNSSVLLGRPEEPSTSHHIYYFCE